MKPILDIIREQNVSPIDVTEAYRETLREVYGDRQGMISICGLQYDAADALESIDPVAFRCGVSDEWSRLMEDGAIAIHGDLYCSRDIFNAIEDSLGESDHAQRLLKRLGIA